MSVIPVNVAEEFDKIYGANCNHVRIWHLRSLTLGFGNKIYHNDASLIDNFQCEWSFISCNSYWRVIKEGKILCSNHTTVGDIEEVQEILDNIEFGNLDNVQMLSEFDMSLFLSNGIRIDFLVADVNFEEDAYGFFCPNDIFMGFSLSEKWYTCLSNVPRHKQ